MRKVTTWYTIYDAATDDLLACGTTRDCARILGMTPASVQSLISRVRHGNLKTFTVAKEDLSKGTYEVYNAGCPML